CRCCAIGHITNYTFPIGRVALTSSRLDRQARSRVAGPPRRLRPRPSRDVLAEGPAVLSRRNQRESIDLRFSRLVSNRRLESQQHEGSCLQSPKLAIERDPGQPRRIASVDQTEVRNGPGLGTSSWPLVSRPPAR